LGKLVQKILSNPAARILILGLIEKTVVAYSQAFVQIIKRRLGNGGKLLQVQCTTENGERVKAEVIG